MIYSKYSGVASLLVLVPMALTGQRAQENVVPLKNWSAPLYWQPSQAETQASGKALPQLQFSANAVSTNALTFVAITPCRLVDTRGAAAGFNGIDPFAGPSIAAKATLTIPVQSPAEATSDTEPAPCGVIPSIAQAYSFNLTVVPHAGGAVDYVSLWPAGGTQPFVATLNDPQGAIVANAAIVPAGPNASPGYGGISVYNAGPATTDVVIDMNGFFTAPTDLNNNTAVGAAALASSTTGSQNTAIGADALAANATGSSNTATGANALLSNTTGIANTASGVAALSSNTTGSTNTASGVDALESNTTGYSNTASASGVAALQANTTGSLNTASGSYALSANTTGIYNTASGVEALSSSTTGGNNTATGAGALSFSTTGSNNTATGVDALEANFTGSDNTATGYQALENNTGGGPAGSANTATGFQALLNNTTGGNNTANGASALLANTTGIDNTADGTAALTSNTTGIANTASGVSALNFNTAGNHNVALGYEAGLNISTGSYNIDIGNVAVPTDGVAASSGVIRIGTPGLQTTTFIAGISGVTAAGGVEVFVNGNGQLGTMNSSRRFKEQITDMGDGSSKLFQLRPVNFFYKREYDDGSHLLQYGLIAEEVAEVYPEMVAYGSDGQILTVKYQMLAPMLLNEVQKQNAQLQKEALERQAEDLTLKNKLQLQEEENRKLEDRIAAMEALLSSLSGGNRRGLEQTIR